MFDKHAREMFDELLDASRNWAANCNHHAEQDMAIAEGMVLYARINGDITGEESDRMSCSIKSIRLNRKAKEGGAYFRGAQLRRAS